MDEIVFFFPSETEFCIWTYTESKVSNKYFKSGRQVMVAWKIFLIRLHPVYLIHDQVTFQAMVIARADQRIWACWVLIWEAT